MFRPTSLLAALLTALIAAAPAGAADDALTTYRNADLAMTYTYPASFQTNAGMAELVAKGINETANKEHQADKAKCVSVPISAIRQGAAQTDFALLLLLRIDHTCMGEPGTADTLGEAAQLLPSSVLAQFGKPVIGNAVNYKLDGHDAAFVHGSVPAKAIGEGVMLHTASVCSLIKQNTVCWFILDSDYKVMPALVSNPVSFDGRPPVPLIDKDMVPKW